MSQLLPPATRRCRASRCVALAFGTLLSTALFAPTAAAQDEEMAQDTTAEECNPNAVATQALAKATFSMQRAFQIIQANQAIARGGAPDTGAAATPRDATRDLKDAIRALTSPPDKKDKNLNDSLGRAYYLGQAYILLLEQPGIAPIGKRGDYGIATDTSFTIDLLAAADSQFTKVEQNLPSCRSEMAKWRQQQPWLDALNGSITALNNEQYDTAEVLAKRSLIIDRSAPYAYSILGNVAKQRKDYDMAIEMFNKVIETVDSSQDSSYADDKLSALYDIADVATLRADAASGPEKKEQVANAITAWNTFIAVGTRDLQVANGVQVMRRLLKSIDDTLSFPKAYEIVLKNPSRYGEATLLNAGLVATQASRPEDAVTLFAAVLDKNPNQRDALNNLAASYVGTKEYDKMPPIIDRLVAVDPNNPDNWMLYAFAYTGLLKATKDPKLVKMYTDSLVKYNTKSEKLPVRVALTGFSHSSRETTLSGTIENRTNQSKTYTLEVEFLDTTGAVLGTQTVNVGPVAPKTSEPFNVTLEGKDAVAFRYKPLE
jgi:tetratricopeptide (TPR) repeat protein